MFKRILGGMLIIVFIIVLFNYKAILSYFYPRHNEEIVEKYSKEYELDSNLIYSIIKTESKFNPYAKSHRGALGLMQITPKTGKYISNLIRDKNFKEDMLYNPEINIKYGCFYLAKLFEDFNGDIDCVLAAYNGGEGNVRKWLKSDEKGERYLDTEEVPFKETKEYIKKVKKDYKIYNYLYEE